MPTTISVPDIGDFESVEIIEILVKPGDIIKKNDPIITLENDKSSVEVPSPFAGKISNLEVTKLAQGVPFGGEVHYLDENTLSSAFQSRKKII